MKKEYEENIRSLELQIKNLQRLVNENNNALLKKLLLAKKRILKNNLIKYRNLILKEKRRLNFTNKVLGLKDFIEYPKVKKILPR